MTTTDDELRTDVYDALDAAIPDIHKLRDQCAIAAMQAGSTNPNIETMFADHGKGFATLGEWLAAGAYRMADAMLEAKFK